MCSCSTTLRITNARHFGFREHNSEHVLVQTRLSATLVKLLAAVSECVSEREG